MSTAAQQQQRPATTTAQKDGDFDKLMARSVRFTPFGESREIELKFGHVSRFISGTTKSGKKPTEEDVVRFMMLCEARQLNPWVGDAYLVGYDSNAGPQWSLITSIHALMKRAEANPAFDGMESGVVVQTDDGTITERQGDIVLSGEKLIGSWAKCYRKDRRVPFYDSLKLETYDKGRSQWEKDKAGMIVKCAEASVLRKAFPSQISGLYISQEMAERTYERSTGEAPQAKTLDGLAARIKADVRRETEQPQAPQTEETQPELSPWDRYEACLSAADDEGQVEKVYDAAFGPDAAEHWTDQQRQDAVAAKDARKAGIQRKKGGA